VSTSTFRIALGFASFMAAAFSAPWMARIAPATIGVALDVPLN
jgi:hypothetical protein